MNNLHKLIIHEPPVQVLPTLAKELGLNEAIVVQQIHYWLVIAEKSGDESKKHDNRWWTYNTYEDWQKQFPWWSIRTVVRIIKSLEDKGIIISRKPRAHAWDHTKWYSIDYENLSKVISSDCQNQNSQADVFKLTESPSENPTNTPIVFEEQNDTFLFRENSQESHAGAESGPITQAITDIEIPPAACEEIHTPTIEDEFWKPTRARQGRTVEEAKEGVVKALERWHDGNGASQIGEASLTYLAWVPEYLREIARAFIEKHGRPPKTKREDSYWRKEWQEQYDRGITPLAISHTYDDMRNKGLTIVSPKSLTNMAQAWLDEPPPPSARFSEVYG